MDHTNVSPATSVLPNSAPSPPRPHDPIAHLIIVCCHAHWIGPSGSTGSPGSPGSQGQFSHPASTDGGTNEGDNGSLRPGEDEAEWLIKEFQKGETGTFIEHVRIGLRELVKGWERWEEVVLVFSGGPTHPSMPLSESLTYVNLAAANGYWDILPPPSSSSRSADDSSLRSRILAEERAMDSLDNLAFSVPLFHRATGKKPQRVSVVSHEFKRRRFEELHFPFLGWSTADEDVVDETPDAIEHMLEEEKGRGENGEGRSEITARFIGCDPPYMRPDDKTYDDMRANEVREMERKNGYEAWKADLAGVGEELRGKREKRNVWGVSGNLLADEESRGEDWRSVLLLRKGVSSTTRR